MIHYPHYVKGTWMRSFSLSVELNEYETLFMLKWLYSEFAWKISNRIKTSGVHSKCYTSFCLITVLHFRFEIIIVPERFQCKNMSNKGWAKMFLRNSRSKGRCFYLNRYTTWGMHMSITQPRPEGGSHVTAHYTRVFV